MAPQPVRKAVLPVAGLGTRFLPATKAIPKEMLTLVDRPLIQHAVEEAHAAGIEQIIFVSSRGKTVMEEHFDAHPELMRTLENRGKTAEMALVKETIIPPGQLMVVRQAEPLGLGHAVWCAREAVGNEPFAVILPDEVVLHERPCLAQMMDTYNRLGGNVIAVAEVPRDQTNRYGILAVENDDGQVAVVKGLVEKPKPEDAPSNLCITGRYILQPEVFAALGQHRKGAGGEIQLTDGMAALIGRQPFHGVRFEGERHDCGNMQGWVIANVAFALKRKGAGDAIREALQPMLGLSRPLQQPE